MYNIQIQNKFKNIFVFLINDQRMYYASNLFSINAEPIEFDVIISDNKTKEVLF